MAPPPPNPWSPAQAASSLRPPAPAAPPPNPARAPRRSEVRWRLPAGGAGLLCALLFASCRGHRDVLDAASPQARGVSSLWWIFFATSCVVLGLVLLALLGAIARARRRHEALPAAPPRVVQSGDPGERRHFLIVTAATAATIVILFALLLADFATGRSLLPPRVTDALTVKVTGHQWWWQVEYEDPTAGNIIATANELHLPVGRPVQLLLQSNDVIHSFWIPNLQGKKDLIPGKPTVLWLKPDRIGRYHGQCAEFCGLQHAHMGLLAVVESAADFQRWQEAQRRPAPEPRTESQQRGREVFLTTSCVLCHTIQGTIAHSRVGPPLTHLAGQQMIGANSFPNRRGYLAGWIVDPQSMKPGVRMPQNLLGADDLNALLDYLEILQ